MQILHQAGPRRIFVSDVDEGKLARARHYGATDIVNAARTDAVAHILHATGGRGVDLAFEAVGVEETLQTAMAITRLAGDIVAVGNISKMGQIHIQGLVTREQRLIGTYGGSQEFAPALDMIAAGRIDLKPFIDQVWPFQRGIEAFERLAAGEPGLAKVVLSME